MLRIQITVICCVIGVIVLASCGGSNESSGTSSDEPLRVFVSSEEHPLPMIGAPAAEYLGLYKKHNVEVDLGVTEEGVQALASGDADITLSSPNRYVGGIAQGLDAKIIGPTVDRWAQLIIVGNDSDISSPRELKGKTFGITSYGSSADYSVAALADEYGWNKDDYDVVVGGDLDSLKASLRNGNIDAFTFSAQTAFRLEHEGVGKVIGDIGQITGPAPLDVIAVSESTLNSRPDDVKNFCDAYYSAQTQFKDDHSLAAKAFRDWDEDTPVLNDILKSGLPILAESPDMTDTMLENITKASLHTIDNLDIDLDDVKDMYVNCDSL